MSFDERKVRTLDKVTEALYGKASCEVSVM